MINLDHAHWKEVAEKQQADSYLESVTLKLKSLINQLPMFQLAEQLETTLQHASLATEIQGQYTDVVLLGTGGSSLGAQVLYQLCDAPKLKFHFLDNIDPITFQRLWKHIDVSKTLFLIVSKSGSTPETVAQALSIVDHLRNNPTDKPLNKHLLFMSEPNPSPLRRLSTQLQSTCLDVPADIGGRFSVLSFTGLFPALLMGLDIASLIEGAQQTLNTLTKHSVNAPCVQGAVLIHQFTSTQQRNQLVLMPYVDQLESLGRWWRQLWAESLGKDGKGTTPIHAMGTVDQHSQLQLYLEGPDDKLFTFVLHPLTTKELKLPKELAKSIEVDYLIDHNMGDLLHAEQLATIRVLREAKRPVRTIQLPNLKASSLGQLLMTLMLETLLMAELMGINAFNQPAVESGKCYAKQFLINHGNSS